MIEENFPQTDTSLFFMSPGNTSIYSPLEVKAQEYLLVKHVCGEPELPYNNCKGFKQFTTSDGEFYVFSCLVYGAQMCQTPVWIFLWRYFLDEINI